VTFCTEGEARDGEAMGLMRRASQQFHWFNHGYADFDGFLDALSSRKRKNIRKETERAQAALAAGSSPIPATTSDPSIGMRSGCSTRTPARGNGACPI
jgi:hypothetical protein